VEMEAATKELQTALGALEKRCKSWRDGWKKEADLQAKVERLELAAARAETQAEKLKETAALQLSRGEKAMAESAVAHAKAASAKEHAEVAAKRAELVELQVKLRSEYHSLMKESLALRGSGRTSITGMFVAPLREFMQRMTAFMSSQESKGIYEAPADGVVHINTSILLEELYSEEAGGAVGGGGEGDGGVTTEDGATHYDVLGVQRDAKPAEIKSAFHAKSKIMHPDRPGGSEAAFQELQEAYKVLSDAPARRDYDRTLATAAATVADTVADGKLIA